MSSFHNPLVVMSIAGMDPSAGAGVLADIKTIGAFGCYGVGVVTSLTLQNTRGVSGAYNQSGEAVRRQLEPLFEDFKIAAIKTGMLPTADVIEEVAKSIGMNPGANVVVDPIMQSTSGHELVDGAAMDAMSGLLFPLASIITPNAGEAERITGLPVNDEASMEQAAHRLLSLGPKAVLVTGGDLGGESVVDLLVDVEGSVFYRSPRVASTSLHGTGCALSSALACLLAKGIALREAVRIARQYVADAIRRAPGLGHGSGPLDNLHLLRRS
jgi:hydroxymethylpyrimidine/phosphomethylpyrimidine kinase